MFENLIDLQKSTILSEVFTVIYAKILNDTFNILLIAIILKKNICHINKSKKKEVLPRFELGLMDSKSSVLTVTP